MARFTKRPGPWTDQGTVAERTSGRRIAWLRAVGVDDPQFDRREGVLEPGDQWKIDTHSPGT